MTNDFEEAAYYGHLRQFFLEWREDILLATNSIEVSRSGELNAMVLHNFFIESALEIRNSLRLFELGFIDAAFFSVRSAVETARVVTLFTSYEDAIESEIYHIWKSGDKFPFDSKVKEQIKASSDAYSQVHDAMPDFFSRQASLLKKMQKYIHKQGYRSFYHRSITAELHIEDTRKKIEADFKEFIYGSTIEIALLRLCIDAFPILLSDDDVRKFIHWESLTIPYSNKILEIMGPDILEKYKSTDYYRSFVKYFKQNHELSEESWSIVNESYFNRSWWEIIQPDLPFLSYREREIITLFMTSKLISKIYYFGGIGYHFSDVKSKRTSFSMDSRTFQNLKTQNVKYDEAFLSHFPIGSDEYWLEHNKPFTPSKIKQIQDLLLALEKDRHPLLLKNQDYE